MKKSKGLSRQFYQKVNLFFDNEMPVKEKEKFMKTMKENPDLAAFFDKEKTFRKLVKTRLQKEKPSNSLIRKIKERIRKEV